MIYLRERRRRDEFIRNLGRQFRCHRCQHKGAEVEAKGARLLHIGAVRRYQWADINGLLSLVSPMGIEPMTP